MNRNHPTDPSLELSGDYLTLADSSRILHGQIEHLRLTRSARPRVEWEQCAMRDIVDCYKNNPQCPG